MLLPVNILGGIKINRFQTEKGIYILLTLTAVLWGGNSVTAKYTVGELSPIIIVFIRFAGVSIILLTMTFWFEGRKSLPSWRQIPSITALGLTGILTNNVLYFTGVKYSTAVNASLIGAANPVITAAFTAVFLNEHLNRQQLLGITVSFTGVGIVITKGSWTVASSLSFNFGDVLLLLASVSWTLYSVLGRKVMKDLSPLASTAWASLIGSLFLFVMAFEEGFNGKIALSLYGWESMIYMIIGSGVLAFYWWNQGVLVIGPNRASIFTNIIPLAGMVFAALLLNETISVSQIAGAGLIIAGVLLTTQIERAVIQTNSSQAGN